MKLVRYESAGRVATITMDRASAHNALNNALCDELREAEERDRSGAARTERTTPGRPGRIVSVPQPCVEPVACRTVPAPHVAGPVEALQHLEELVALEPCRVRALEAPLLVD